MSYNEPEDDTQVSAGLSRFRAALSGFKHESTAIPIQSGVLDSIADVFSSAPPSTATTPKRFTRSSPRAGYTPKKDDTVSALASGVETASLQSPSPSPRKRNRAADGADSPSKKMRGYAPPEVYAHLNSLTDRLQPNLDVVFCGINPGVMSATRGAHYGNPVNHFWKALHASGFTNRQVNPLDEHILPDEFSLGLTDIVERPTTGSGELSKADFRQGVPKLLAKLSHFRPRIVCLVGKEVWLPIEAAIRDWSCTGATSETLTVSEASLPSVDSIPAESLIPVASPTKRKKSQGKRKKSARTNTLGLQPYKLVHPPGDGAKETLFFVMVSTSPIVSQYQFQDKVEMMKTLRAKVESLKSGALDAETAAFRSLMFTSVKTDCVA